MSYQPEIPLSFQSANGLVVATFGLAEYEWQSEQALLTPSVQLVGADYEYDQLGTQQAKKASGIESVRFIVYEDSPSEVDAAIRDLQAKCLSIGLGKLWTEDSSSALHWAWARALAMPSLRWQAGDILKKTVDLKFRRQSDWQEQNPTVAYADYTGASDTFVITNDTGRYVYPKVVISGTWTTPVGLQNATNGLGFTQGAAADDAGSSTDDWLIFDGPNDRVDRSYNAGVTRFNARPSFHPNAGQVPIMALAPGDNSFSVTDGDSATARATFTF